MIEIPKKEPLNIVPFIDIMLVLLAMVLSISTFIAKGEIQINLPEAKSSEKANSDSQVRLVQVDSTGTIYWDGEKVTEESLDEAVRTLPRTEKVVLRMDKDAKFDHFIRVVDLFKKHKHENFIIATEKTQ